MTAPSRAHCELIGALVRARYGCGLTQQQVADRLGVTRPSVSMFESPSVRVPLLSSVLRYAEVVGVRLTIEEKP